MITQDLEVQVEKGMMKLLTNDLFRSKIVLHAAGCSSHALKELCIFPGSSRVVLEGCQFYSKGSTELELKRNGFESHIEKFVSQETAERMAQSAFCKGQRILEQQGELKLVGDSLGIGISGQIGHHRINQAFLSVQSLERLSSYHLSFEGVAQQKDQREMQDIYISDYIFKAIEAQLIQSRISDLKNVEQKTETLNVTTLKDSDINLFDWLSAGNEFHNVVIYKKIHNENKQNSDSSQNSSYVFSVNKKLQNCVVFSGSFNPIHDGHVQIALEAKKAKGRDTVFFEIGLKNPDKAQKDSAQLLKIVDEIFQKIEKHYSDEFQPWKYGVVLSKAGLFAEKCKFVENASFALGADTFKRILDAKYYNNSEATRIETLSTFLKSDVDFVLAPRLNSLTHEVESYEQFDGLTPDFLKNKVTILTGFRNDISSTEIRNKLAKEAQQKQQ